MAIHGPETIDRRSPATPESAPAQADLVFDFSGMGTPDAGSMGLVLTARLLAGEERRRVWVRAMPDGAWQLLDNLGLDHLFEFFPNGGRFLN